MRKFLLALFLCALIFPSCESQKQNQSFQARSFLDVEPVIPRVTAYRGIDEIYRGYQQPPLISSSGNNKHAEGVLRPVSISGFDQRGRPAAALGGLPGGLKVDPTMQPVAELIYGSSTYSHPGVRKYRFGVNDQLTMIIRDHEELSGKMQVLTDGTVQLPLLKTRVRALDLTKEELKGVIAEKLKKYVRKVPLIEIGVDFAAGQYFYVLGEVQYPGRYAMGVRPITVSEAVFRASTSTLAETLLEVGVEEKIKAELNSSPREDYLIPEEADLRKVYLITPHPSRPLRQVINVKAILYEGRTGEDKMLQSGQIIFVPSAIDARFNRFVQRVIAPLRSVNDMDDEGNYWYGRFKQRKKNTRGWRPR